MSDVFGFDPIPDDAAVLADPEGALARAVQEVFGYLDSERDGDEFDLPPTLFALVSTAVLAVAEPQLQAQLDDGSELTPIEQPPIPEDVEGGSYSLDEYLGQLSWPTSISGVVLAQDIVVVGPAESAELEAAIEDGDAAIRSIAEALPGSRRGRLVAGALRDGPSLALMRLEPTDDEPFGESDLLTSEGLADALIGALYATLEAEPED